MTTEKQIAALIQAGADPVLISKMRTFPPSVVAPIVKAAEEIVEEVKEKRKPRKSKEG